MTSWRAQLASLLRFHIKGKAWPSQATYKSVWVEKRLGEGFLSVPKTRQPGLQAVSWRQQTAGLKVCPGEDSCLWPSMLPTAEQWVHFQKEVTTWVEIAAAALPGHQKKAATLCALAPCRFSGAEEEESKKQARRWPCHGYSHLGLPGRSA